MTRKAPATKKQFAAIGVVADVDFRTAEAAYLGTKRVHRDKFDAIAAAAARLGFAPPPPPEVADVAR